MLFLSGAVVPNRHVCRSSRRGHGRALHRAGTDRSDRVNPCPEVTVVVRPASLPIGSSPSPVTACGPARRSGRGLDRASAAPPGAPTRSPRTG